MNTLASLLQGILNTSKTDDKSKDKIINIVIPKSGWILSKIGERTEQNCRLPGVKMKTSFQADPKADVNYYCDIQNTYFGEKTKLDIGFITHAHMNSGKWLLKFFQQRKVLKNIDGIVSMNKRYTLMCGKVGFPKEKLTTIIPGQTYDIFTLKKITIGIVSKGGALGYGQKFMEDLFLNYDLSGFKFRFLGSGWKHIIPVSKKMNIEVELLPEDNYSIYPKFYHEIDFLLIPYLWGAGPMSFQEALASGIPIISADIGFAGYEFQPDYIYPPGNTKSLYKILQQIRNPLLKRRKQVEQMTWEDYASKLVIFFKKMEKIKKTV